MSALLFRPSSPAIERAANLLLLALAISVLLTPAAGWSWLLAALGLVLVAWPLAMAERAMSVRAAQPLIAGLQVLTREADAGRVWRVIAWSSTAASVLALVLVALMAGALATQAIQTLSGEQQGIYAGHTLWPILTVASLLLALLRVLGRAPVLLWLLPALLLLVLLGVQWQAGAVTPIATDLVLPVTLPAPAALLLGALLLGGGLGAHWYQAAATGTRLSRTGALTTALLAALFLMAFHQGPSGLPVVLLAYVAALLGLTVLAQPALAMARTLNLPSLVVPILVLVPVVLLAEAIWYVAGIGSLPLLAQGLAVWMALNLLLLSLFAGWVMKVSHVRKALQLPSEGLYNLWRVGVRWVAPITLLAALYALLSVS